MMASGRQSPAAWLGCSVRPDPKIRTNLMNRRNFLTGATVAAGFLAVDAESAVAGNEKGRSTATGVPMPFIETRDHAALFYKAWGTGKPVLFVHSWAANSELW